METIHYNISNGIQQSQPLIAKSGRKTISVVGLTVSEKYDGIRALYLGNKMLVTAKGDPISVPDWFIIQFPENIPLDGELFIERERFNDISSIVRSRQVPDATWRNVKFMAFDIPVAVDSPTIMGNSYRELDHKKRQALLSKLISPDLPNLKLVEQHTIIDQNFFDTFYKTIVDGKGEGVVVAFPDSLYSGGKRVNYKHKPIEDSDAVVIGYRDGNGKNTGLVGSLTVRPIDSDGQIVKDKSYNIGTGLTVFQRTNAHTMYPIGTVVVCVHNGLTSSGLPRFPRLKGIRITGT